MDFDASTRRFIEYAEQPAGVESDITRRIVEEYFPLIIRRDDIDPFRRRRRACLTGHWRQETSDEQRPDA